MVFKVLIISIISFIFPWCPVVIGQNSALSLSQYPEKNADLTPTVHLSLGDETSVSRSRVFLSDIAQCSGNELLCQETYGIEMIKVTPQNPLITLTDRKIREIVEREWPLTTVKISGARQIKVKWVEPESDWNVITDKILARLEPVKKNGFVLEAKITKLSITDPSLRLEPIGFNTYDLENPEWVLQHLSGKKIIKLAAYDQESEEPLETLDAEVIFELRKQMISPIRDLFRTDEIKANLLQFSLHKVQSGWDLADLSDPEELKKNLIGRMLKHDIKAGQPIFMRYTEKKTAIKRNQMISVIVGSNSLAIGFQGKALEDGAVGDFIEVLYPHSKRTIKAQVVDSNSASLVKVRPVSVQDYSAEIGELK